MRTINLKNKRIVKILEERGEILKKAQGMQVLVEKTQKEQQKIGYKMTKLQEKYKALIEKQGIELEEFEVISELKVEKGELVVEIVNQIEEYKDLISSEESNAETINASGIDEALTYLDIESLKLMLQGG